MHWNIWKCFSPKTVFTFLRGAWEARGLDVVWKKLAFRSFWIEFFQWSIQNVYRLIFEQCIAFNGLHTILIVQFFDKCWWNNFCCCSTKTGSRRGRKYFARINAGELNEKPMHLIFIQKMQFNMLKKLPKSKWKGETIANNADFRKLFTFN